MDHEWERSLEYLTNYKFLHWAGHTQSPSYILGIPEMENKSYFYN